MKLYHYPACSTCKQARKWLEAQGLLDEAELIHIVEQPPSREELERIWALSGLDLKRLFNTSGQSYRDLDLKDRYASLDDAARLDLLAADGKLIRRPICVMGDHTALVGFKAEEWAAALGSEVAS